MAVKGPFNVHIKSDYSDVYTSVEETSVIGQLFAMSAGLLEVTLKRTAPERPLGYLTTTYARVEE